MATTYPQVETITDEIHSPLPVPVDVELCAETQRLKESAYPSHRQSPLHQTVP